MEKTSAGGVGCLVTIGLILLIVFVIQLVMLSVLALLLLLVPGIVSAIVFVRLLEPWYAHEAKHAGSLRRAIRVTSFDSANVEPFWPTAPLWVACLITLAGLAVEVLIVDLGGVVSNPAYWNAAAGLATIAAVPVAPLWIPNTRWFKAAMARQILSLPYFDPNRDRMILMAAISQEENLEVRRAMITLYGEREYIKDSNSRPVHEDEFGKLWSTVVDGMQRMVVEVQNATPERDGTFKTYILNVPPDSKTAHAAVAWTFNMAPESYHPNSQT